MANYDIVLDTETAPTVKHNDNNAHPETSLVYDFGWLVRETKTGEIVERHSYIISETFFNSDLMNSAYYANKLPQYHSGMGTLWQVKSFRDALKAFQACIKTYKVKTVWAFNARFDRDVLNNTVRTYSNGYQRFAIPYKVEVKDIWARCANITGTAKYVKWAYSNGFVSESGNPKTSAEVVYRYLTDSTDFVESHTALADSEIEAFILTAAQKCKKRARKGIGNGWRDAASTAKRLGLK